MERDLPVMLRLLASAVSVASEAGAKVRQITKTGQLKIVDKGIKDYQTEADRLAQRLIVASLANKFPDSKIVGEEDLEEDVVADKSLIVDSYDADVLKIKLPEQYKDVKEKDITIWVDPLDGTTEFVKGLLEHVTVLIGISVDGKSVAGVIHQPFYGYSQIAGENPKDSAQSIVSSAESLKGRTIWGLVGLGCFGQVPRKLPDDKLIVTTTASHGNPNIEESLAALKADEVLKVGGAGHKVLLVIEGKAHTYVFASNGCKRWDTGAPEAVLEAAGGRLTDIFGKRIEYHFRDDRDYQNRTGIIASVNEQVHQTVLSRIPDQVKQRLEEQIR